MEHRLVLVLLLCGALVGCMSAGVEVTPQQISGFKHGVTKLQDVTTQLGPASVETTLDDGSTLLVYTYVSSRPHPESYLPFIGTLIGGADTRSSAAVFLFDANGILKSANVTTSNVGTGLTSTVHTEPAPGRAPVVDKSEPSTGEQTDVAPVVNSSAPAPDINVETLPAGEVQHPPN